MSKRFFIVFAVVWTAAIGLVGLSMLRPDGAADPAQQASSSNSGEQTRTEQRTAQQNSAERDGADGQDGANGRNGEDGRDGEDGEDGRAVVMNSGSGASSGGSEPGEVTLKLGGEPGVEFSGRCVVDGEERQISGQTPETLTYEPEERIECEITSQSGPLQATFSDGRGTNMTQTLGSGAGVLELSYEGGSFTSSANSGSQTNSSQSVIQQSSSSVAQSGSG